MLGEDTSLSFQSLEAWERLDMRRSPKMATKQFTIILDPHSHCSVCVLWSHEWDGKDAAHERVSDLDCLDQWR